MAGLSAPQPTILWRPAPIYRTNVQKFFLIPSAHPALREVSEPVKTYDVESLRGQLYWLQKLRNKLKGAGLAANQLGDTRRWFAWERGLVINPEIISHGDSTEKEDERCLSFPGLELPIERWVEVRATYVNENGTKIDTAMKGPTARIFQHELDHLNGICIDQPKTKL